MIERVECFLAAVMRVFSGDYHQVIGVSKHTGHGWEFGGPENFVDQKVEERWTERAALGSTIVESMVIEKTPWNWTLACLLVRKSLHQLMSLPPRPALIIAWMIESLLASSNAFSRSRKTAVTLRLDLEFFALEISLIRAAIASSVPNSVHVR